METKLWIIVLIVSSMTAITTQMDLSSMSSLFGKKEDKKPPPVVNEYGQSQPSHFQPPQKEPFKFTDPFKLAKQELKLDLKLEKEKDKFLIKQDKLQPQDQYSYSPMGVAAPVENPTYSTYIPSMNQYPYVDDGSYSNAYYRPQPYGHPPPYRPPAAYRAQDYNTNISAVAYDTYRSMYGYNNPPPAHSSPAYGPPPSAPAYGPPPSQYATPSAYPAQHANVPYNQYGPPMGAPVVVPQDAGYHEAPRIDYSKYITPMPYAEVSEYLSPAQYNDYTGMLYSAYNIPPPAPPAPQYSYNYTAHRGVGYNSDFKMVVAVVVLDGSHNYNAKVAAKDFKKVAQTSIQGTLFISEIYPYVCLVSGVVTGLPPNYKYGIAIHSFGDLTNGCASIGPHFNPDNKTHGNINAPNSHAGDLGNLRSDAAGVAFVNKISRNQFSIQSRNPVAGRSIGVCEKQDDLGLGGNIASLRDGNCGRIMACGIIGLANTGYPASNSGYNHY